MSTFAEIEHALFALPRAEHEAMRRKLEQQFGASSESQGFAWPVPPPAVSREELVRVHALIEAEFPTLRDDE